ncbi:MAG: YbaN family protein [Oscillospiraceae bacterium]|jgi:uncharacterized membrane protein YbaN (DUF454 family)|nr:YbaN family protein [Oscillospiraceae bacterium]
MLKKTIFTVLGLLAVVIGTVGIVVPLLPTVPLYVLALYLLPKGSGRFAEWFAGNEFCRKRLERYTRKREAQNTAKDGS